jgi:hypothetical protein
VSPLAGDLVTAGLVNRGQATLTAEKVRARGKLIAVAKVRITAAGRDSPPRVDFGHVKSLRRPPRIGADSVTTPVAGLSGCSPHWPRPTTLRFLQLL